MKAFAVLLVLGVAGLLAKEPNAVALAGVYLGQVDGGKALVMLKADGTALVKPPDAGEDVRVRGTWKREKPGVVLELTGLNHPNEKVTVRFRIENRELVLVSVTEPDGNFKTHEPPRFKQTKAGDKKFAGEYKGKHDGDSLRVVFKEKGKAEVWPDDTHATEARFRGTWNEVNGLVVCVLQSDGGEAKVQLQPDGKDFLLLKLENPDGKVSVFEVSRFKRVKKTAKDKPIPVDAKTLVGIYLGKVEGTAARIKLRANGTASAWPDIAQKTRHLQGKWELKGKTVKAILKSKNGGAGTIVLEVGESGLILTKVIDPDDDVTEHKSLFKKLLE